MDLSKSLCPDASPSLNVREQSFCSVSYGDGGSEIDDEYYSIDNTLGDDWDPSAKLEPLMPLKYSSSATSDSESTVITDSGHLSEEAVELFFGTFVDLELEGEVNLCSWTASLSELCPHFSEKELYSMFSHIDCERSGYIDAVDFTQFCGGDDESDDAMSSLREDLLSAIRNHPFFQRGSVGVDGA